MLISRNWLQTYFKKELPSAQNIAETLMMHSFELEGIQDTDNDQIIDIDVLPNRAHDCLSHNGIAREYSILTGYSLIEDRNRYDNTIECDQKLINVTIENSNDCHRYMARIISGVTIENSPTWLQEYMKSIGQKTINNIVDATNYVMFDTGNPIHAFDADKVVGEITIRNAIKGETITVLGGQQIELEIEDVVIADDEGILAIAGIKGGIKAAVTHDTKNIIIEVANFNPLTIRNTSRRIKILTDSSKRFENQISSEIASGAMDYISRVINDITNMESIGTITDIYLKKEKKHIITVSHRHINRLLGVSMDISEVENILLRMDYQYHRTGHDYVISIPLIRLDLRVPVDIIEEIGRIYGYYNIPSKDIDEFIFQPRINQGTYIENKLKNIFINKGISELKNYNFVKKGEVQLQNPLASNKSALRNNLHKELLNSLEKNSNNFDFLGIDRVAIFEIGRTYQKEGESDICCIAILNKNKKANKKYGTERDQLESLVNDIGSEFNIDLNVIYQENSINFDISQCSQEIVSYQDIFNIDSYGDCAQFHSVSAFPYVTRDISFWAPQDVSEDSLRLIINSVGIKYLRKIFTFDLFHKEGRTSYGFSLIFQSDDKTLTDQEVGQCMSLVEHKLSQMNCEIR